MMPRWLSFATRTKRRKIVACGGLLICAGLIFAFVQPAEFRRGVSKVIEFGYAVYDPDPPRPPEWYGPRHEPDAAESSWEARLSAAHPTLNFSVTRSQSVLNPPQIDFRDEDFRSPAIAEFQSLTHSIQSIARDPFEMANAVRSLSEHNEAGETDFHNDPSLIFKRAREGSLLTCHPFSLLHVAGAAAQGYSSRVLGISRTPPAFEHAVSEVYIPREKKWVLFDTDHNLAYRRGDEWLDAGQLHTIWISIRDNPVWTRELLSKPLTERRAITRKLTGVETVSLGPAGAEYRQRNIAANSITGTLLEFYDHVFYPVRNDYLSGDYPFKHPILWRQYVLQPSPDEPPPDIVAAGTVLKDPAPMYWSVGRTGIQLAEVTSASEPTLRLRLSTWTPNFRHFECHVDGKEWVKLEGNRFEWTLHEGVNSCVACSVNAGGLRGETTSVEITVHESAM